ncbi:hypothetical protein ES703_80302 [subsurface metagenome]
MVKECFNCGRPIRGDVVAPRVLDEIVYIDNDGEEVVLMPEGEVGFCSAKCAWRHGIKFCTLFGMTGKAARRYLKEERGLTPPTYSPVR